mmetsp:Transcript_19308/g.40708  ORF Transcript_19308/g.40708 Transcript_19308/m.40708 type:complete len:287 (-) Transcript_19308:44-904(-)
MTNIFGGASEEDADIGLAPGDGLRGEVAGGVHHKGYTVAQSSEAMELQSVHGLIGADIKEGRVGVEFRPDAFEAGEGGASAILLKGRDGVGAAVLGGLVHGALGPRTIDNVGGRFGSGGTEVHGHGGELSVAAALGEEDLVLVRDLHRSSGEGEGALEDGSEFGGAVRQGHGSEALLFGEGEASRADRGLDGRREAGRARREVEDLGCGTVGRRGERPMEGGVVGADGALRGRLLAVQGFAEVLEAAARRSEEVHLIGRWVEGDVHGGRHDDSINDVVVVDRLIRK